MNPLLLLGRKMIKKATFSKPKTGSTNALLICRARIAGTAIRCGDYDIRRESISAPKPNKPLYKPTHLEMVG
jgi:hypothetical protein